MKVKEVIQKLKNYLSENGYVRNAEHIMIEI